MDEINPIILTNAKQTFRGAHSWYDDFTSIFVRSLKFLLWSWMFLFSTIRSCSLKSPNIYVKNQYRSCSYCRKKTWTDNGQSYFTTNFKAVFSGTTLVVFHIRKIRSLWEYKINTARRKQKLKIEKPFR